jgi:hypothetical protein
MIETNLLRDIAVVVTPELYQRSLKGVAMGRSIRRIEYPTKLDISKHTISRVTKALYVNPSSIIILPQKDVDELYIPFILDSGYIRVGILDGKVNVRRLATVPIANMPEEEKVYYCRLERLLLSIALLGEEHLGYEYFYTAERLLADIRDGIVFEIYNPEFFHIHNIRMVEHWKHEIDLINEKKVTAAYEELVALVNSMLSQGNMLYDNLNRFNLLLEKFTRK